MSLGIAIMGHHTRAAHIAVMCERLQVQVEAARAAGHDVRDLDVFVDEGAHGPWWNNRRCWERAEELGTTHYAVLQDDLTFCADLPQAILAAVAARPWDALSLYYVRSAVRQALEAQTHWVSSIDISGQANVMPTWLAAQGLKWILANEHLPQNPPWKDHDDTRWCAWLKARKKMAFVTVPNLVQHVGHQEGIRSVMNHYGPISRRTTPVYIGDSALGSAVDWADLTCLRG